MSIPSMSKTLSILVGASLLLAAVPLQADDGAASIAAGGIVMVHEPRITMQKEVRLHRHSGLKRGSKNNIAAHGPTPNNEHAINP
jgi:hypothetical protein